jgi:hypothetical protein
MVLGVGVMVVVMLGLNMVMSSGLRKGRKGRVLVGVMHRFLSMMRLLVSKLWKQGEIDDYSKKGKSNGNNRRKRNS